MKELKALVKRNQKLFFKDKGMFFTSLITPLILLVLYATFLGKIYRDSFSSAVPEQLHIAKDLINGCAGGQLVASLLAVSCVTVAFCSNMLMVQDKVSGSIMDLDRFTGEKIRFGGKLLSGFFERDINHLLRDDRGEHDLSGSDRLVFVGCRHPFCDLRCVPSGHVWNSTVFGDQFLFKFPGADLGSGNHRKRRLRVYLRCLYAAFPVFGRTSKGLVFPARYLRYFAASESSDERWICCHGRSRDPVGACKRSEKISGLQY